VPSCRDREGTIFAARRDRTWQSPGFNQKGNHPVVCISFDMAVAYADWLSKRTGKRYRLPNAVEWRSAGSTAFPANCSGNIRDASYRDEYRTSKHEECSDGFAGSAPVASFAARKSGLYVVDGNAREWVSECAGGNCKDRLALGMGWHSASDDEAAPAFPADNAYNTIGFRILRELQ
jgi:formylglycine-generating enzyme required for sulfatase activity